MDRIRVGVVGCGEAAQIMHLPSLSLLADRFAVTALCDVSRRAVDGVGDRWRVAQRFVDPLDLIHEGDVDAVLVTNPHAHHAAVTVAAAEAGRHVLVEKPLCLTLREADEVIAAQRQAGVVVQVGYVRRYAEAFEEACAMVPDLGPIRLARVHDVLGANHLISDQTTGVVRSDDLDAGVLAEGRALQDSLVLEAVGDAPPELADAYVSLLVLNSHDLSAMRELLGLPTGLLYAARRQADAIGSPAPHPTPPYLTAAFDYRSYVCQFDTGFDDIPRMDATIEVYGADRVLSVAWDTGFVRNLPCRVTVTGANGGGGVVERVVQPSWTDPFVSEWLAFHDNICRGTEPKTSPADARHDLVLARQLVHAMAATPAAAGGASP